MGYHGTTQSFTTTRTPPASNSTGSGTITGTSGNNTLTGTSKADVINGLAGDDTIKAGNGNDTITGGTGNDVIDGGAGTDVAVFSGNRSNYLISQSNGVITVKALSGTDGTDTLTNVESLKFADQTVKVPAGGFPDILASTPTLSVQPAAGSEDTSIPLAIAAALTDTDGSESLKVTIGGVPAGATLSAGVKNADGTWTLTGSQLTGLKYTPPHNADGTVTLSITATSTESNGGNTASRSASLAVKVTGVADAPTLAVTSAHDLAGKPISLDGHITAALTDTDRSETLSFRFANLPTGATLNHGIRNSDGSWSLKPADLSGLTITPPAGATTFALSVQAISTEDNGTTASTIKTLNVTVDTDVLASAPTLSVQPAAGNEDTAIPLAIAAALTDTDGSETLKITIGGVPAGASLSAGVKNADGTWTLTSGQLAGLKYTPPHNADGTVMLSVTATSTESNGGKTASASASLAVKVTGVADAPTLAVTSAHDLAGKPISLDGHISATLTDTDGSETLGFRIANLPTGATLNHGIHNSDGSWSLKPADLSGLTITPPAGATTFALSVQAISTEDNQTTASTTQTLNVTVDPAAQSSAVAQAPWVSASPTSGPPNTAIPLAIAAHLVQPDPGETLTINIAGVPTGATLNHGTNLGSGTWTLTPAQLSGLTITLPASTATTPTATGTILTVGPGGQYSTIAAAIAASHDGDTIQVQAGTYTNDFATINTKINLVGVGGMVHLVATGNIPNGKAILITNADVTITNFEFSGAQVVDGNGAGIRYQAGNLTLNNTYFHDNQDGLLAADNPTGSITINNSEFANNGVSDPTAAGYGLTHNLYVNHVGTLTITDSYFHDAAVGHEIKSRALNTIIQDSRIVDGTTGTASYSIDLPNGGNAIIKNNVIEQGPHSQNPAIIAFGEEGSLNANTHLQVTGNTILNDLSSTSAIAVNNLTTASAQISGNQFFGLTAGQIAAGPNAQSGNVMLASEPTLDTSHPWGANHVDLTVTATATEADGSTASTSVVLLINDPPPSTTTSGTPPTTGDVVGFALQNNQSTALAAHEITFGEVFAPGQVPQGSQLAAVINGVTIPVQLDVKTTNADGSVKMGIVTLLAPSIPANTTLSGMLALTTPTTAPSVDISKLPTSGYSTTVDLTLHNADGSNTAYHLDAGALLAQALKAGTVSYWMQGPQATEVRVDVPISGSLHVTFDITSFANGTSRTDVQFNNDYAMQAVGGEVKYDAKITQNGSIVLQQSNIDQFQYQTWHKQIWSNGAPQVNIQHDIAALEKMGVIQNYDLSIPVNPALIANEATAMTAAGWGGVLGANGVTQYMPTTGGRGDIGPTTQANTIWLMTQNETAAKYALGQADAAGSVPWHFFDPTTNLYASLLQYPRLWTDPRGGNGLPTGLTQQVDPVGASGWTPDGAHQPDLSYVAYLMTGDRYYLDQLNAQATFDILYDYPAYRQDGLGLVVNGQDQVRQQAWSLRQIDEAAWANPDGSAEKAYFSQVSANNWHWLVTQLPIWTAQEGDAYGYIPQALAGNAIVPWQQDFFASTVIAAAEQGNQDAVTVLEWEANFLVGRFLNGANGFDPHDGVLYALDVYSSPGTGFHTWAQIEQATQAAGDSNNGGWSQSNGYYGQLALMSLAGIITVTGSTDAMQAYNWLLTSGAPYINEDPTYNIAPRLPDGVLLQNSQMQIDTSSADVTLTARGGDSLLHAGGGNDTLIGGTGTCDLLFGGTGNTTLKAGTGNDYLFGGTGNNTFVDNIGNNFMKGGPKVNIYIFNENHSSHDTIANFNPSTDQLQITHNLNGSGNATVADLIASATVANGNTVLHLGPQDDITLLGVASPADLSHAIVIV